MKIVICGSGYVGFLTGGALIERGHYVIFYDVSEKRVAELRKKKYCATGNPHCMKDADIIFIAVPTPQKKGGAVDTAFLEAAIHKIAMHVSRANKYPIIVIRSTVVPSELKTLREIFEIDTGRKCGRGFGFCAMPEFATMISGDWTKDKKFSRSSNQNFIVLGAYDKKSERTLEKIYKPFKLPFFKMTPEEAAFTKYINNSFLGCKVSFWNEMAMIAEKEKFDIQKIADILSLDNRIGRYGSIITGWKNGKLYRGGYAKSICFEKDIPAFIKAYPQNSIMKAVDKIDRIMRERPERKL